MAEQSEKAKKEQSATLLVVLITNFVIPFSINSLNVAVPHIGDEFSIMATHLTWIILAFTMTTVVLTIPFGRIADIKGRDSMLKVGILIIGLAALGNVYSPNVIWFFSMRVLQGVGGAMAFATNVSILVDVYPANKRGSVLGLAVAAVYTGSACGPVLGGLLTHHFGWRSVFLIIVIMAAVAFVNAMLRLPKGEVITNQKPLNLRSIFLYMIAIGMVAFGLSTLMQNIWSYFILAAGIVFSVIFVRHELKVDMPVIDIHLIRNNPTFTFSNLASLFNYAATFAIAYMMSLYLQLIKGLDADMSGIILISQPIVQTIISPIAGRLSDKRSPYALASLGMGCCTGSLVMLAFINETTPLSYVIAALVLVGIGFGVFSSPNSNIVMSSVKREDYSMASAVQSTMRTLGQVICMATITLIMNFIIGNRAITDAPKSVIVLDMHVTFTILACVCVVGIFFSSKRNPRAVL